MKPDVGSRREITDNDKAGAVWQHYTAVLDRDEEKRQAMPTLPDMMLEHDKIISRIDKREINPTISWE